MLTLGLTGCAAKYAHPMKSTQDFERDQRDCQAFAEKAAAKKGVQFVKKQGTALRIKKGGVGYFGNLLYLM